MKYAGFQSVKLLKPQKSAFDMSHTKRSSTRMGRLTPVFLQEAIPGDVWRGGSEILLRLAPLLAPIYDSIELFVHFFFCPNRLLWQEWETFITGGRLGVGIDPVAAPVPPFIDIGASYGEDSTFFDKSNLADYMGVPILSELEVDPATAYAGIHLDIMPFAAYQLVWYEYYRDRNFLEDAFFTIAMPLPSGDVGAADLLDGLEYLTLKTRAYMHDYFTSALPFTQRGEEVLMPLAGTGSVTYLERSLIKTAAGADANPSSLVGVGLSLDGEMDVNKLDAADDGDAGRIENIDEVLLTASSVSINDFRSAYALQVWLERNAVGGSRYTESTQAHFGVKPQDSRLQRPEYVGGGRIQVKISEVVSTAYSNDGSGVVPLANMAGHGVTYGNTNQFNYFCVEHGFIIGIASIMNPPSYHQGLPRMFRRRSFLDYPWPTFSKLGEQQVDKAELYANAANLTPDADGLLELFGYQSRYADWKYVSNTNHGDFHDTLLFWTLTREFADSPELSEEFVQFDDETQNRIFAVGGSNDNFWMYIHNRCSVKRALPYFGTPNTLGFS